MVATQVHSHLWERLGDMYDNECIFDRLGCAISPTGEHVVAGAYGELAVFNAASEDISLLKTCVQPFTQNVRYFQALPCLRGESPPGILCLTVVRTHCSDHVDL